MYPQVRRFDYWANPANSLVIKRMAHALRREAVQDIRRLSGVNQTILGPISWGIVNNITNLLNDNLYALTKTNSPSLNFQGVVMAPDTADKYSGSLRNLILLSLAVWRFVTVQRGQVYNVIETNQFIDQFAGEVNKMDFKEPQLSSLKSTITDQLTNWKNIIKNQ